MKKYSLAFACCLTILSAAAQTNYALSLNGSNQYISIGTPIPNASSYTKEAWVYQNITGGSQNIISSINAPFWIAGSTLSAGQAGSYSLVTDPVAFPTNRWVYVAVTYDAPTTTMKLYRDGILVSTNASVGAYTSEATYIGSHQGSSSFFNGSVDEFRIWSTALTQVQLKQNALQGPAFNATGLRVYFKFNENGGTTLVNACTNTTGLDGTIQNAPAWVSSPVQFGGNAISFDGTNDIVNIPDDNTLDITSAITLEAWVYATKNSGIQNVINKSSNAINNGYIFPRTDNGWTSTVFYLHLGGWKTISAPYPGLNAWHHLAATWDGTTMKIYIDGSLAASGAQSGSITTNSNPLTLGNQTGYSEYFGGTADEFRVWNVARSQAQIQADMNKELDPTTQTGLVSYYTANQGIAAGTNTGLIGLMDQKGINNGTLSNFALSGASSNFLVSTSNLVVLPLGWLRFTVQKEGNNALLNWSTAFEQNTKNFTIQFSKNGVHWDNVGVVAASGNSTTTRDYSYLHTSPVNGVNYYRVMQTDLDDRSSFSEIRQVKFGFEKNVFTVLTNPARQGSLDLRIDKATLLSMYNSEGKLVFQQQFAVGLQSINTQALAKGLYLLKTTDQTEKILVQ